MTRKALARRIAEVLFNEPATRRAVGAAPTRRAVAAFGRALCCSSVKDHCGYSPSWCHAPGQNPRQRCYTSRGLGALVAKPADTKLEEMNPLRKPSHQQQENTEHRRGHSEACQRYSEMPAVKLIKFIFIHRIILLVFLTSAYPL